MTRARHDAGFSLLELLITMTLMLVVLFATLTAFESFSSVQQRDGRITDAQDAVRQSVDVLERQLRNLATPTPGVRSIARATGSDLVFQTADPQKRWMRYCIDPADPSVERGTAALWQQTATASTGPPAAVACPQPSGWSTTTAVGRSVVNARDGLDRPVFLYDGSADAEGAAADTSTIRRIRTQLWVDTNPGADPGEQRLASGVFLRNQNQTPVAGFAATPDGHGVVLNAAASVDPEGQRMTYYWYSGAATQVPASCAPAPGAAGYLGTGIAPTLAFPPTTSSPLTITLCVVDPGGLTATTSQVVRFS